MRPAPASIPGAAARRRRLETGDLVLWGAAGFLLLFALGSRGLWSSEGRWAEITREMFRTGDFFHPTVNGEAYYDKPLLGYWLVALASLAAGRLGEWAVRIPSALAGLAAIGATVSLGTRLWDRRVGRCAGWILLTTYGMLFWGRTGTAEMENVAAAILAVAWYWGRRERPGFVTFLVFYLICFAGAQTKGLTSVAVPALAVAPDLLRGGRWRRLLRLPHVAALAVGLAAYLVPFLASDLARGGYRESGLALMFRENVLRYFRPFDHREPFYLYLYYLPVLLLPWSPWIVVAAGRALRSWRRLEPHERWLLEATLLIFAFFTASGSRRGYYILPILPFCALLGGVLLAREPRDRWWRAGGWAQGRLLVAVAAVYLAAPLARPLVEDRTGFAPPPALVAATFLLGVGAMLPWILGRLAPPLLPALLGLPRGATPHVASIAILMGGFFCWQQGTMEPLRTGRAFALELRARVAGVPPERIAFFDARSAIILFYLDPARPVRLLRTAVEVAPFLAEPPPRVIIARRKHVDRLLPALPEGVRGRPLVEEPAHPWQRRRRTGYVAWRFDEPVPAR